MSPFSLPIPKFAVYSGMGETKIRELIAREELESVVVGGRRMILVESYHRLIEKAQAGPQQDARHNKAGAIPAFGTKRSPK